MKKGTKQLRALSDYNVAPNRTHRRPQLWTLALGLWTYPSHLDLLGLNGTKSHQIRPKKINFFDPALTSPFAPLTLPTVVPNRAQSRLKKLFFLRWRPVTRASVPDCASPLALFTTY